MRFFDYKKIAGKSWDSELLGLVGAIYKEAGKQDIIALCPSLSLSSIEGSLRKLVANGEIVSAGKGKNTFYTRIV